MEKMILLFDEFIMKAITLTESLLENDYRDGAILDQFTSNRERLLAIIDQISKQIDWTQVAPENCEEFSRKIDYIKKLDEKLLTKLQEHQQDVKKEVEKVHKQKENIKGYNLSDVK
jgi:DNA repair ATPase RecN